MTDTMRIGLNLLYFRAEQTGGGETYAKGLLGGLRKLDTEWEFFVFVNSRSVGGLTHLEGPKCHVIGLNAPNGRVRRHLWEQINFNSVCNHYQIDLLHSLGNVGPLWLNHKRAVTIHDLLYKHAPGLSLSRRLFYSCLIPLSAKYSDAVITVSQSTYDDLRAFLNVSVEKLFLVPEGPGQEFSAASQWLGTKAKYRLPDSYFLAVGTAQHKRLDITLDAVKLLREKNFAAHLVVVGGDMESTQRMTGNGNLTWLGYVPQTELAALYRNAAAVICSSEIEGFGLPVLEAMSLGTPVISTNRGSLLEVVGDGGLLVECGDADSLASAMLDIQRATTRVGVIERGRAQVATFSWELCAMQTAAAYRKILYGSDAADVVNHA